MPGHNGLFARRFPIAFSCLYIRSVPPVDQEFPRPALSFRARMLMSLGVFGDGAVPAEIIDHDGPRPDANPSHTWATGEYQILLGGCRQCHGPVYSGKKNPPKPGSPPGSNLTPAGNIGKWSDEEFFATMRTGVTPEFKVLDHRFMPWIPMAQMTDQELSDVLTFLRKLPALETYRTQ